MISICSSWSDRSGSASLHLVEIEILHLLDVRGAGEVPEGINAEDLVEEAQKTPEFYPALCQMSTQQATWHITGVLKRIGFSRTNINSKHWSRR